MTPSDEATAEVTKTDSADTAWKESLREVMHKVIATLPDHATLGELIEGARTNAAMAPVLNIFTVQELIEAAKKRPKQPAKDKNDGVELDEDGHPGMDLDAGPRVIRRRADVPDGDLRILRALSERGPQRESELSNHSSVTAEQLRLLIRHLRGKGLIHVEGSGAKRRLKITRSGNTYLRRNG